MSFGLGETMHQDSCLGPLYARHIATIEHLQVGLRWSLHILHHYEWRIGVIPQLLYFMGYIFFS